MSERSDPPAKDPAILSPLGRDGSVWGVGDPLDRAGVRLRRYAPGDRVFEFGAPVDTVFELVQGCVVITTSGDPSRRVVDLVQPGRFFGFTAHARQRCAAVAATGAIVCCLNLAVARRNDRVAARIDREMRAEIDRLRAFAALVGRRAAIERIAGLFSAMVPDEAPAVVHLPVTRGEIADLLGLAVETVCRNLTKMKRDGLLIEEGGGIWRIADPSRLARLAAATR
ncbi:MAG: Crp/Fnr family transcriptional regulator [Phyllobacteriaceae bacterium]|nr:Crp/Fnr family transcriptional regulator [Phyllobacteriaceae bacterium]